MVQMVVVSPPFWKAPINVFGLHGGEFAGDPHVSLLLLQMKKIKTHTHKHNGQQGNIISLCLNDLFHSHACEHYNLHTQNWC